MGVTDVIRGADMDNTSIEGFWEAGTLNRKTPTNWVPKEGKGAGGILISVHTNGKGFFI